jgi:hypothetical protein
MAGFGDIDAFIQQLRDTGLIANAIDGQARHYLVGEHYFEHIAYMGCAPSIQFEPGKDNHHFCHVRLHSYENPILLYNRKQARKPRCPVCHQPLKDWSSQTHDPESRTMTCPSCHQSSLTEHFGWQKMAGFARAFIEITDVFPKEAVPQPELLDRLANITGNHWHYFYCCA